MGLADSCWSRAISHCPKSESARVVGSSRVAGREASPRPNSLSLSAKLSLRPASLASLLRAGRAWLSRWCPTFTRLNHIPKSLREFSTECRRRGRGDVAREGALSRGGHECRVPRICIRVDIYISFAGKADEGGGGLAVEEETTEKLAVAVFVRRPSVGSFRVGTRGLEFSVSPMWQGWISVLK